MDDLASLAPLPIRCPSCHADSAINVAETKTGDPYACPACGLTGTMAPALDLLRAFHPRLQAANSHLQMARLNSPGSEVERAAHAKAQEAWATWLDLVQALAGGAVQPHGPKP